MSDIGVIILAAGQGTRMKSALPKVMHPVAGRPMLAHVLESSRSLDPVRVVVVTSPDQDAVRTACDSARIAVQDKQLGTGHAVLAAAAEIGGFSGDVVILFAADPLVRRETIERMLAARRTPAGTNGTKPAVVVLGFRPKDPAQYGRLVVNGGVLEEIVEFKDASPEIRAIDLCNSGVMVADGAILFDLLREVKNDNAKKEYYLTDIIAIARRRNLPSVVVEGEEEEVLGVNSRDELALVEAVMQKRLRERAMAEGATLQDPSTAYFSYDTRLGRDVTVGPNVVFGPAVTVGDNVTINAFCHIEGATIADGAIIGPFARLRPGADISEDAHVGNFVEIKNAILGQGAKVNHLSYIGDTWVGPGANIGAGTITCNYDGFNKHLTIIGAGAFIGSNSTLVPPITVDDGAYTGAGSVITKNVAKDGFAVTRAEQINRPEAAARYRKRKAAEKASGKVPKPDPKSVKRKRTRD